MKKCTIITVVHYKKNTVVLREKVSTYDRAATAAQYRNDFPSARVTPRENLLFISH